MNTAQVRIAILGFWHVHAKDFVRDARAEPGVEIVAGWDADAGFGRTAAEALDVPFTDDLDALLAREDVDGVVVTTETTRHGEVIPAALRAGKHVITEKVLAPTRAEAEDLARLAAARDRVLHVSLFRLAHGSTRAIREQIGAGAVGMPTHARVRVAHDGAVASETHPEGWLPARFYDPAAAGGGATIDLGAHPLYLLRTFLGMPEVVQAVFGEMTGRGVEDHSVVTLRYPNGALAVAETGFVSAGPYTSIEIDGTRGNLLLSPVDGLLRVRTAPGGAWEVVEVPEDGPIPFRQWLALLPGRVSDPENLAAAIDLSALAEAVAASAATMRAVRLNGGSSE
ncbi:MAG: Gfo/Idh/MocA family protein [Thermomicrobiales bacterium]